MLYLVLATLLLLGVALMVGALLMRDPKRQIKSRGGAFLENISGPAVVPPQVRVTKVRGLAGEEEEVVMTPEMAAVLQAARAQAGERAADDERARRAQAEAERILSEDD